MKLFFDSYIDVITKECLINGVWCFRRGEEILPNAKSLNSQAGMPVIAM